MTLKPEIFTFYPLTGYVGRIYRGANQHAILARVGHFGKARHRIISAYRAAMAKAGRVEPVEGRNSGEE